MMPSASLALHASEGAGAAIDRAQQPMSARPGLTLVAATVFASVLGGAVVRGQGSTDRLIVSLSGETKVVLVDPDSTSRLATFDVRATPHEIVIASGGVTAYVVDPGGPSVSALDTSRRERPRHLDIAPRRMPHDVRVSRDGKTLWVACAPDQSVVEIDAQTGAVRRDWKTGADGGWFVAVTPDERKIYVPHLEGNRLTSIDRGNGQVTTVIGGGAQSGIDISPDGREVWVVSHEQKTLSVIDAAIDRVTARIGLPSDVFGRVRFTSDGARVVLVQDKQLTVFDARTRQPIASIDMPLAAKIPAISADNRRVALSNPDDNRVTIVTLSPLAVEKSFEVGKTPDGVAWVR
jgi:YVTN family beta-propeller protein